MASMVWRGNGKWTLPSLLTMSLTAALALCAPAAAQNSVPPQLLEPTRPVQGDTIRICIDPLSIGAPFDRAVSQAIADALLLKAEFRNAPSGFPMDGLGYLDELQLAMNNDCDVLAGISIAPEIEYPDWATVTRPYAQVPFSLVVTDPSYNSLQDIPRDKRIGTALGSLGELVFITYISQLPQEQQWRRLPYADPKLMVRRLLDDTLAGILIWQPALNLAVEGNPDAEELRTIPTDPVPTVHVAVGMLVSNRNSFLRAQLDDAIGSLVADGTIARIMEEHGYEGTPGP